MEPFPSLRPRLLERYVAREFLKIFCLSLAAFLALYLVVDFFERIDQLLKANLGWGDMGRYVLLKAPVALEQVLSPAVLLGALLAFGLLSRTHETMAIRASGLDILRLTRPVLLLALLAGTLLLLLRLYLLPWSQSALNLFWETQVQKKPPRSLINLEHFWYKGDRAIYNIFLYRKSEQTLEGVKIFRFDEGFRLVQVVAARKAVWRDGVWRLYQGVVQNFDQPGEERLENFAELDLAVKETPADFGGLERKIPEMTLTELLHFIHRLERDGYKSTPYRLEVHCRGAMALAPLILAVVGMGLALREEQVFLPGKVAVALAFMFAYWLVVGFSTSLGQAGRWPLLWAAWLPHLIFGTAAVLLLRRISR